MRQLLLIIVCTMTICLHNSLFAQSRSGEKRAPSAFTSNLWYGGQFALGFSSNSYTSLFQFGLSPMVGYKLLPAVSAGPRISVLYNHYRIRDFNGNVETVNPLTWSVGVFGRVKVLRTFFGHVEYAYESQPYVLDDLSVARREQANTYLGAGYNSAGGQGFGYEILVTYNISLPDNVLESPFDIRVGFTYNF